MEIILKTKYLEDKYKFKRKNKILKISAIGVFALSLILVNFLYQL